MKATFTHLNVNFSFTDKDVINPSDFIPKGEYNPHNVQPWLLHDHGFTLAVVFAGSLQDAIDEAVDAGNLDWFMVPADELTDYGEDGEGLSYLGSAGEPFDIEGLDYICLCNVPFSFAAMFMAAKEAQPTVN